MYTEYVCFCVEMLSSLFQFDLLPGKHRSSKVKETAATVHRKLKTFMEITLEEDSIERYSVRVGVWD
jgi:hypothetical protein